VKSHSPLTDEAGIFPLPRPTKPELLCSRPTRPNTSRLYYGDLHDEAGYLSLEADEALALHYFHSFVLMHTWRLPVLFGDDDNDHLHSLIGGVLRFNTADVINRSAFRGHGNQKSYNPLIVRCCLAQYIVQRGKLYFVILQ
jgi:hypothetical protein